MKTNQLKFILFMMMFASSIFAQGIIVDHRHVDASKIPDYWIQKVKEMHLNIIGESHGRGYIYGIDRLDSLSLGEERHYSAITNQSGEAALRTGNDLIVSKTYYYQTSNGTRISNSGGEEDFWTTDASLDRIDFHLDYSANIKNNNIDALIFGWCYDMTDGDRFDGLWQGRIYTTFNKYENAKYVMPWDINTTEVNLYNYINAVEHYLENNPSTTTVFSTGPVDGGSSGGIKGYQRFLKNEEIRNYVKNSNKKVYLFDYADILTHDSEGNQNLINNSDYNEYFPSFVSEYSGSYDGGFGGCHINEAACIKIANALWFLMARIAGWDGNEEVGISDFTVLKRGKTEIDLNWNAPSGQVQSYNIYRNGTLLTTTSTNQFTDVNIPTGYYNYQVSFINENGEESKLTLASTNIVIKAEENSVADIYVGGWEADNEYNLTPEEIELLKSKTIILGSRSYGLNVSNGINRLINNFASSRKPAQGIPIEDNYFEQYPMLTYMCDLYNRTARVREFESFFSDDSHTSTWMKSNYNYNFRNDVDIAFLEVWSENDLSEDGYQNVYETYKSTMERLQSQFPGITFVFYSHQINFKQAIDGQGELNDDQTHNLAAKKYNNLLFNEILGNYPIYDFGDIVSTKSTGEIDTYVYENEVYRKTWPEYNVSNSGTPDGVHPNSNEIQERLGKGFLTVVKKIIELKVDETAPEVVSVNAVLPNRIDIKFNEAVNIDNATFTVTPSVQISSTILEINPKVVSLNLAENLDANKNYQVTINNVIDISGNAIDPSSQTFDFQLSGIPVLEPVTPVTVNVNEPVSFQVLCDGENTYQLLFTNSDELEGALFTDYGNNTGSFTWTPLVNGVFTAKFIATDGIVSSGELSVSITVNDVTSPTIVETKVNNSSSVEVMFSENLQPATTEIISNYLIDNNILISSITHDKNVIVISLDSSTPLQENVTYTLTVNNVEDLSHNAVDANTRTTFIYESIPVSERILIKINFDDNIDNQIANGINPNWQNGEGNFITGYEGSALLLDGTIDCPYVVIENDSFSSFEKVSASIYAKKNEASSGGLLFLKHTNFRLEVFDSRISGYLFVNNGTRFDFDAKNLEQINNTNWHHYEMIYDGTKVSILIDGVSVFSTLVSGTVSGSNDYNYDIILGRNPWGLSFNGAIDNFELLTDFQATPTYSITLNSENGSVSTNPDQPTYIPESIVELTAIPVEGYLFVGWDGDASGSENPITVTVNKNLNITALFKIEQPELYTLNLNSEYGSINANPKQEVYEGGSLVELSAVPDDGYKFVNWSGNLSGAENPISITIDSNMTVSAVFTREIVNTTGLDSLVYLTFENNIVNQFDSDIKTEWANSEGTFINGQNGMVLQLDGTREGSYPVIKEDARLTNLEKVFISIDAKKNSASSGGMLFIKHVAYRMFLNGTTLSGYVYVSGTRVDYAIENIEQINNINWHTYQIAYDGNVLSFIVDDLILHDVEINGIIQTNSDWEHDLLIARHPWGESFNGAVDNFILVGQQALTKKGAERYPSVELPSEYELTQNYPNPFNPTTMISYALPKAGLVSLKVYNMVGQEVAELVNNNQTAGIHNIKFNASELSSGIYIYRIISGEFTSTRKMLLLK